MGIIVENKVLSKIDLFDALFLLNPQHFLCHNEYHKGDEKEVEELAEKCAEVEGDGAHVKDGSFPGFVEE